MTQTPKQNSPETALAALLAIMARLREPKGGCPWDLVQDFASIAPYTIEEGYEVADATAANDPDKLLDELGDLLFQVVYHAQMAAERGWFGFAEIAQSISDKMIRRHPHVFGEASHALVWAAASRAAASPKT
jgi:ATP diphosphatase